MLLCCWNKKNREGNQPEYDVPEFAGAIAIYKSCIYNYFCCRTAAERRYVMGKNLKSEAVDHLFEAIMTLKNLDEYYAFFEDVCTVNELLSLSQRYEVARMLRQRKTYLDIAEKTGASTATISRVNRSLNYGNDAYDMVFERLNIKDDEQQ